MTGSPASSGATTSQKRRGPNRSAQPAHQALAVDPYHPLALAAEQVTTPWKIRHAAAALDAALTASPTSPALLHSAHQMAHRIHYPLVVFSLIAESFCLLMATFSLDPEVSRRGVLSSVWAMMLLVAAVTCVPTVIGLGRRTRPFLSRFYAAFPVKRATAWATVALAPAQLGVILATGDDDAIAWASGLSLLATSAAALWATVRASTAADTASGRQPVSRP
ncbi:MAG: hypothetical protein Q4G45_01835 [Actinomycetia bacterium]|nr:hypothetical protein [Actinomycetes bacterium]